MYFKIFLAFISRYFLLSSRLEMVTSPLNSKVAVKRRATRCSREPWVPLLVFSAILALASATKEVATNSFYVKIKEDPSQPDLAHKIARRNGFHNVGPVSIFFPPFFLCLRKCISYLFKILKIYPALFS